MQKKLHIKKDDTVLIISGKDKGKKGKVLTIDRAKSRVIVEGNSMVKKHTKPQSDKANPEGGIVEKESSIHISNVMLVDPATGEATKTGRKMNDDNKLIRYSKKTGEEIKS